MPGEEIRASNVRTCACLWSNVAWVCAELGFIVHTVSGSSNRWSGIWGGTVGWKMGWNGRCRITGTWHCCSHNLTAEAV